MSGYFLMPVHGRESSPFGMRFDPFYKRWQLHAGVDIAAGGGTPIRAAASGRVIRAGWAGGYGNYTCISHGLYTGPGQYHDRGIATCYGHQSRIGVRVGQRVSRGQVIGRVGETGAATGYHLHFEVRINGRPIQPVPWLPHCWC
jgi:murein DD-endopeptidase MepM/ murein hydrolase activator NlpD